MTVPIYRFSPAGIERITRQVRKKPLASSGLALLAGFAIIAISTGTGRIASMLPVFAVGAAILWWIQNRSAGRVKALMESTQIELTATELTASNSAVSTTIRQEDIVELRTMPDGIFLRTREIRNAPLLRAELAGFEDLAARLEQWVPAAVPRVRGRTTVGQWSGAAALASLALMVAAFTITDPLIGIVCCLAAAAVLTFCVVWVWRSPIDRRTKLLTLVCVLPVLSLLGRAYLLGGEL